MSIKTARKDNTKYLGKDGTQAWRVSIKVKDDWWANMIYDEALLPVKGKEYEIELKEEGEWKNWDYKLLSKKEQVLEQTAPETVPSNTENPLAGIEPIIQEQKKEEYKPRDYDNENRGKIRTNVAKAFICAKQVKLTDTLKVEIEEWVEFIFTGK